MLPHLLFPLSLKDEEADDEDDDDDEYADVSDGLPSIDGTGTGNLVFFILKILFASFIAPSLLSTVFKVKCRLKINSELLRRLFSNFFFDS